MLMLLTLFSLIMIIYMSPMSPMKMTFMLTLFSLMLFIKMGLVNSTFMYSYMMFLIMIGGVIILILYFTSLIVYKPSFLIMKYMNYVYLTSFVILSLIYLNSNLLMPEILEFTQQSYFDILNNLNKKINMKNYMVLNNLNFLYSSQVMMITLFCITTLLLILYFIAKISLNLSKPLRIFKF